MKDFVQQILVSLWHAFQVSTFSQTLSDGYWCLSFSYGNIHTYLFLSIVWHCTYLCHFKCFSRITWNTPGEGEISKIEELPRVFRKDSENIRKKPLDLDNLMLSSENIPCLAKRTKLKHGISTWACSGLSFQHSCMCDNKVNHLVTCIDHQDGWTKWFCCAMRVCLLGRIQSQQDMHRNINYGDKKEQENARWKAPQKEAASFPAEFYSLYRRSPAHWAQADLLPCCFMLIRE